MLNTNRKGSINRSLIVFLLALFFIAHTGLLLAASFNSEEYRLGAGDKIRIQVFGEDDLTVEALISDAGTLSYPFLGEIKVKGRTVQDIESYITRELKGPYLVNPEVTVSILQYRQFYVNGHVAKPGGFPFQPGMTVRKAISLAGGFGERANKEKIFVVHAEDKTATPVRVQLDDYIEPGDIITVERSFF